MNEKINAKTDFYLMGVKKENNIPVEFEVKVMTLVDNSPFPIMDVLIKTKKEVIDMINNGIIFYTLYYSYKDCGFDNESVNSIFNTKTDFLPIVVVDNTYLRIDNDYILEDNVGSLSEF